MLKNYLKVAFRNLWKKKGFSFINITGLSIGMASAVLILLWIYSEISFDQFHEKSERIYQMYNRSVFDGKLWCWGTTPKPMGAALRKDYPQVENAARVTQGTFLTSVGEKHLNSSGYLTDPDFLKIFSFPLLKGDAARALGKAGSIVITEKLAQKLFGEADAFGKVIRIDSIAQFTVTGIMKDLPANTRFDFEFLLPWSYMKTIGWDDNYWGNNSVQTYVLLKPGVTEAMANNRFRNITKSHSDTKDIEVFVHPITKWRLYSKFENGQIVGGRIGVVRLFGIIAGFILLIACINFMNLSTARSEKRAKEVGIRKVVGAQKGLLVSQFLGESILISLLAGMVAMIIVQLSLSGFNELTDKHLSIPYGSVLFWLASLVFVMLTGIIAGSYPAFYLSAYKPVSVLKGTFKAAHALVTPRKILVVMQFTFAIGLIICTIIVNQQIRYAQARETGYKKDNLVYTFIQGDVEKHYTAISNELLNSGAVTSITKTSAPITQKWSDSWGYSWKGKDPNAKLDFCIYNVDGNFAKTTGLRILRGRDIDVKTYPTDSNAMLLNEAAVKIMGFKDPIGQTVTNGDDGKWHVVGVIPDFILSSPYEPVSPMIVQGPKAWFNVIHLRLNSARATSDNLAKTEAIFKKYNPDYPPAFKFVDDEYGHKFAEEKRIGTLSGLFAGLTIVISCLGLFALATYMAENRIKEIGVRKVLGASVSSITTLLSTDFLKLVCISFVVAVPLAWWGMHTWLQSYTYRVPISIWVFAVTGVISVFIAVATISYQAIKAAIANPVKSLRTE
ncbi:ABC transporter permease [Hufsiella ginkgonis]|uniref:FtsX-like permease family protein n=1 Tax=Hufsiella ginkgonis TaxID=2695274 RepID=A0A7K1XV46_9SPHI|nr:ABC transporter permease [Hufsiella ginkgonis]MXV14854.1 FtsX-like permease family protein [Hufsiella ginkgonis]